VEEKTMEQKMAHSFLNDSGSGMESEWREGAEISTDGDDGGSEDVGPPEVH
jgi:hypothetical protein